MITQAQQNKLDWMEQLLKTLSLTRKQKDIIEKKEIEKMRQRGMENATRIMKQIEKEPHTIFINSVQWKDWKMKKMRYDELTEEIIEEEVERGYNF